MAKSKFEVGFVFGAKKSGSFDKTFSGIKNSVKSLTKTVAAAASAYVGVQAFKSIGTAAIESASSLESYRSTLNVVLKDEKRAAETMRWAVDFANSTPFETDSIVEATVRLASYGVDYKDHMASIGDMAGVMNKDIMQAVEAVADAQTGELERMKEFGITKAMIAEKAGEMYRGVEIINNKNQIVNQRKFNDAMFALMDNKFKGGMEIQANSFKGIVSTIKGVWSTGLATMAGMSMEGEIIPGSAFDAAKKGLKLLSKKLQEFSESGAFVAVSKKIGGWIDKIAGVAKVAKSGLTGAFDYVKSKVGAVIERIKGTLVEMKPVIDEIKEKFGTAGEKFSKIFEAAQPIINNLIVNGLPVLLEFIGWIAEKAAEFGNFVADNWGDIVGIVGGIVGAILAMKVIGSIIGIVSGIGGAIAFLATPAGWVAMAIAAVIAVVILLAQNWDAIKAKWSESCADMKRWAGEVGQYWAGVGDAIKTFFSGVGEWIGGVIDGAISAFKSFINIFISGINWIIGGLNKVSFTIPDWLPGGGETIGIKIREIPMLANGGIATMPTLAMVGEGRESEAILPLSKLASMLNFQPRAVATAAGGISIVVNLKFYGNTDKASVLDAVPSIGEALKAAVREEMAKLKELELRTKFKRKKE